MKTAASLRLLIIEDDVESFGWVRRRIRRFGFQVDWAKTLAEGIEKLADHPSCVILDLSLPDGSGAEVIKHIRANNLPINIAVVSGTPNTSLLCEGALLRPDAFFSKPVDAVDLIAWLSTIVA